MSIGKQTNPTEPAHTTAIELDVGRVRVRFHGFALVLIALAVASGLYALMRAH